MKKIINLTIVILMISIVCMFAVFPFVWILSTSIKPAAEIYQTPSIMPDNPTLEGFRSILFSSARQFDFKQWLSNSIVVASITTAFSLVIASLGGYGLSRFRFMGRKTLSYSILITQVIPGSLLIIPLYVIMNLMNLINTLTALVLAYTTFSIPFCTWMMKGFFDTIPKSLDEAAVMDGCGYLKTFTAIIAPLTVPGLLATGLFSFINGWNEYLFASILVQRYNKWTITVGLASFVGQYSTNWAAVMAGATIITVPVILVFLFLQKYLVSGMTAGAVKQ